MAVKLVPSSTFKGGESRPQANFDDTVAPGVDPDAKWRKENSQQFRRHGTTAAQRAGVDPGYTPGYGRAAAGNRGYGLTDKPQWDSMFTPHLGANSTPPRDAGTAGIPDVTQPVAPPATVPPVAPPVPPMPVTPSPGNAGPQIQQINGTQTALRQVVGLPSGQRANASFVPGQNSPANLAKRTRPAVDPYS